MKRYPVLAVAMLLLFASALLAQSSSVTLTKPYYSVLTNFNPATGGFNAQFNFNQGGIYRTNTNQQYFRAHAEVC